MPGLAGGGAGEIGALTERSVNDVDANVDAITGAGGPRHCPNGLGRAASPTDNFPHVVGSHTQLKGKTVAAPRGDDFDATLVVGKRLSEVLQDGLRRPGGVAETVFVRHDDYFAAFAAALTDREAANCSAAPEIFRSLATVSVG